MKILLTSIGTRGDMEPFLAIAEKLKHRGHEIICLFPEQFQNMALESGFQFESLGPEFIEMLESDTGKFALGGGGSKLKKIQAFIKLSKIQARNNRKMLEKQFEVIQRLKPDRIVHNGKVMYPVLYEISHPHSTVFVSPVPYVHYVKGHTHIAFHSNYGELLNKFTFWIADWGLKKAILAAAKQLELNHVKGSDIKRVNREHKVIYTISPSLFNRPAEWPSNFKVLGYHERDKAVSWEFTPELNLFLEKYEKVLFISFGSMTNPEPEQKTRMILEVLKKHKIPAIINTSMGGLKRPSEDHELFHFVDQVPYDQLFPKVYAVMHHGGSGTTHMGLGNACPTLIIPHIIDQFVWNQMVAENQLGPRGISISKLNKSALDTLIPDLMNNQKYKENCQNLAQRMSMENFEEALCEEIISNE